MDFLSEINVNTKEIALKEDIDKLDNSKLNTTDAAASANKINTDAGSVTQPVYFKDGVPVETTYTLAKSVPSDAVFTDTKYTHPSYTAKSSGLYKVTVDSTGHVSSATAVTKSDITALGIPASDTNTHYTSKNVVNSSNTSTSNTETALTNGNVYLISVENGAVTSAHKISGSGATTVTTDASGNIVINSTNTKYNAATTSANGLMTSSMVTKLNGISDSADSVSISRNLTSGTKVGTITINGTGTDLYAPTNTDTHYTTGLKVGASSTATANAAATNGNVYLNALDNTTVRDSHKITGSGATTVTSDANGVITISSTDTKYTSLKNPYALTIQGNGTTLTNGTYDGSAAKTVNITPSSIGAAASSHGTHVTFSTTAPKANGTAAVGSATTVSRSDHVHPLQTSVSGNAGTATKLATARTINGVSFDGSANIIIPRSTKHIHTASGTEGSTGYVKIATIKVTGNYANHPVEFVISQRSRGPYHLYVQFNSEASTDPTLYEFKHFDPANKGVNAYIVKSATSTWDIYIQKQQGYDHIYILDVLKADGDEGACYSITYTNDHASSLPTNYRVATLAKINGYTLADACAKGIINNTSISAIGWVSNTESATVVPTINTIAYWNGAHTVGSTASNLAYCNKGAFGTAATKNVDTTATSGSSNLITSGAMYTALAGKAPSSHGTHVTFSTTAPKANGTAAVGSATTVSRSDHVHPLQTSVSGNAGTATKWATARNINGLSVDGTANRVNYGTCSTAAATAAKVVACIGFVLVTGAEITVKFTVTNTAASPTLNVNSTGAKAIYYRGSAISAGYLAANRTYTFRYNGTQYDLVGDINTDTNTDTKNTTGSTNTSSKIYLIGATSQSTNPVTYSHDTVFVDSGGVLNSSSGIKLNSNGMYLDSWANFICGSSLYSGCSWHMDNSDGTAALKLYPHEEQKTLEINNRTKFSYGARVYSGTLSSGSATVTITNLWNYTLLIAVAYNYGYLNSSSTPSTHHDSYTSFTIPIPVQYINSGNAYIARLPIDEHVYSVGVGSQIEISKSSTANSLLIKKKDSTTVKLGTWSIYAVI